jgi:Flp pilus assembly protein TadD
MLALVLGGCDNDKVSVVEEGEQSEDLKAFLESPPRTNVSGAHRQSDPHASLSADKMAQVALQHFDEGRPELAVETLNEAIGKYPDDVMLLSIRASMFLQQQQSSLALADLNRAIELNPHDAVLLINRAQAYRQFGRNDEARRPRNTTSRWPISIAASSSNPPYPRLISIAHRPTKLWGSVTRRLATLNIS